MDHQAHPAPLLVDSLPTHLRVFVLEYMVHKNKMAAAKVAKPGMKSDDVYKSTGSHWSRRPEVALAIAELEDIHAKKLQLTAEQISAELGRIGVVDPATLFDEQGHVKPLALLPEDVRRAISSIETESVPFNVTETRIVDGKRQKVTLTKFATRVKSIKFWSKTEALGLLGKKNRMFPNSTELTGKDGGPIESSSRIDMTKLSQEALERLATLEDLE